MREKITGIVLNVRKYNDNHDIVTLFTREKGRLAFISPSGSGKASMARRARLQPLGVVASEINYKEAAELQRLGSISSPVVWTDLYFHPAKRALSLFISEFLYHLLKATMPEPGVYDFIERSLRLLDSMETGISDFHIVFLASMLSYSGIQPDISGYLPGYAFEFASGSFVKEYEARPPSFKGEEAAAVKFISRINFSNMKYLRLNASSRRQILYGLLNYYSYHFPGLGALKSPEILREIFL